MKTSIVKRLASLMALFMLATLIPLPAYATEEYECWDNPCFELGDVTGDCNIHALDVLQTVNHLNEQAILNEQEFEYDACLDVNQDGSNSPMDTLVIINNMNSGVQCPETCMEEDSEEGNSDTEDDQSDLLDEPMDDMKDEIESAMDEIVIDIVNSFEDMDTEEITSTIEEMEEDIEDAVSEMEEEINSGSADSETLEDKIENLNNLRVRIRAEAIKRHQGLLSKVQQIQDLPRVYFVRWGNLTQKRRACFGVSANMLDEAISEGSLPGRCQAEKVEYDGKITVSKGDLKVHKEILFEDNDSVTDSSGSSIGFDSVIAGHWDGLVVVYKPELNDDGTASELSTTLSIGDLEETYKGAEVLGRKNIGNEHMVEIKLLGRILPGLTDEQVNELIEKTVSIQEKLGTLREKLDRLRLMNRGDESVDELEDLADEIGDYSFDEESAAELESAVSSVANSLDGASPAEVALKAKRLRERLVTVRDLAKARKYAKKLIPFKDTDDNEWYTGYVAAVKKKGIISGYKDAAGNELGEFRPGNNITIAEILKIGLEAAGKGEADGEPSLAGALHHWAKGYVKKGEELGLDIVDGEVDLNRPATRAEVVRMMLEALGIKPDAVSSVGFSDVDASHPHAAFVQYAKDLGIISGDAGKTTFRPDAPVNRAEAAKIANLILSIIIGGLDS